MLQIVAICMFAFAITAARDTCTNNQYKRYGEDCSCSDYCLDNSHCLRDGTRTFSCQCLPGLTYDPVKKQCTLDCDKPTCANKPCQHVCTDTEDSYQCSCREGFVVSPTDPTKCVDIDECKNKTLCQQICTNTDGDFECSCNPGFAVNAIDPTKCNEPTCVDKLAADIYFLCDSSNSIASPGWQRQLTFVANTSQGFNLGPNDVQIAFGIFSTNFEHIFNLNTYTDQAELANNVLNTTQLKSNTFTYDALNSINSEGYLTSSDKGAGRNVPKILIVMTDGQSQNITKTIAAADDLRKQNITLLSVGVGVTNPVELQGIARDPKNVFNVRTFSVLDTIRGEITQRVCDVPQPPAVRPCTTNMLLDLAFVVDSSNKFGVINFQRIVVFVSSIIRAFIVGQDGAEFALLLSDTEPVTVFNLTSSMDVIYQSLVNVPFKNNSTNTYNGLLAASRLLTTANGARDDAEKTIILLSDGQSHDPSNIIKEAQEVKNKGIKVVTIGILPEADLEELANVAFSSDYSFTVRGYNALLNFAGAVADALCEEPAATSPEPSTQAPTPRALVNECLGNPCEHICTDADDGFVCSCREGYQVSSVDPKKCEDRDECRLDKPCQHVCNNTEGSYQCSCREGYVLSSSDRTKCNDINECSKKPCQHICTNTEGSFKCSCNPGSAINQIDPTKCQDPTCVNQLVADIYFLGDSSNSIAAIGWGRELSFIVNISKAFRLGPNDVQIAFGIFSTNFRHIFDLNKYTDQDAFASAVLSTAQLKSNTFTYDALNAINDHDFLNSPVYGGDRNVPKVIIVITDGQSQNITKTIAAADNLRKKDITLLSVGVGVTNPVELQGIAGNSKNVFNVNTFGLLDTVRGEITQRICDVPELPEVQACPDAGVLDLVFVIESLNKFGTVNFQRNLVLISSVIRSFTIGQNNVKVALVLSDTEPIIMFNLTSSVDVIYQSIISDPNKNISEITYKGLLAASDFFSPEHGAREGAIKTIVLLSDGKSRDPSNIVDQAEKVKDKGINVVTLGILPEADIDELSTIASKPGNSIQAKSYTTLLSFANQVAQAACHAS
jgi:Mg-chelatase subunit ChlD